MRIQQEDYPREALLSVLGVDAGAWTQRAHRDEIALAFGLSRAAHTNQYGELDMYAATLTIVTAKFVKIDMKRIAEKVRETWPQWTEGLARTERMKLNSPFDGICFVVAANEDKSDIRVEVGRSEDASNKAAGSDRVPSIMPLDLVANRLRRAAEQVGVKLPKYFVPYEPGTAEYKAWIAEVRNYRRFANTRTDKAKARKPKVTA